MTDPPAAAASDDGAEYRIMAIPAKEILAVGRRLLRYEDQVVRDFFEELPLTKQLEIAMAVYGDARLAMEQRVARAHGFESGSDAIWITDPSDVAG